MHLSTAHLGRLPIWTAAGFPAKRYFAQRKHFYNSEHYRITFNVNNLTTKEYYIGYWSVNPQKPRNVAASFAYKP
ncbi:hypothetical protein [Dyadobacter bucti]|uniref:hypothetical protein n=1 Tax=Dyadobacter bucti TaxID=2572203 RepID=UPI003F6F17E3